MSAEAKCTLYSYRGHSNQESLLEQSDRPCSRTHGKKHWRDPKRSQWPLPFLWLQPGAEAKQVKAHESKKTQYADKYLGQNFYMLDNKISSGFSLVTVSHQHPDCPLWTHWKSGSNHVHIRASLCFFPKDMDQMQGTGPSFNQISFPWLLFGALLRSYRGSADVTMGQIKPPCDCKLTRHGHSARHWKEKQTKEKEWRKEGRKRKN